jgi:sulfur carrier protein
MNEADSIAVTVNGEARSFATGTNVTELVNLQGQSGRGFAVAVDGEVVPRAEWSQFLLADGQAVEVLVAVQGG